MTHSQSIWPALKRPVVGMIHLMPLPGSPRFGGSLQTIESAALRDAETLTSGGIHGMIVENFGDAPFYPRRVPVEVVTSMSKVACEIRRRFDVPLGINVLRNDGLSALAIAFAVGASFIRVNVLTGARVTDQGLLNGIAHRLQRRRTNLRANGIQVFADVNVKHSAPLAVRDIEDEVRDTVERGRADLVIVSGSATGQPADVAELQRVKAASSVPVFVGSGVHIDNVEQYLPWSDGFLVGTAFKLGGIVESPVDLHRVSAFVECVAQSERDIGK
jgi:membrane complex biogenesis BtpA family protein